MSKKYILMAMGTCLSFFMACGERVSENYNPNPQAKKQQSATVAKPKSALEPAGRFSTQQNVYYYDSEGKRNPFEPYDLNKANFANSSESPLEKFKLSELALVGVIWGIADPRGMIKAPNNSTYVVRRRSRIGNNKGKVSRVAKNSIFVKEEYRDPTGEIGVREIEIELQKDASQALSKGLTSND